MSFVNQLLATAAILLLYPVCTVLYNIYFHPLRHFPGPKAWAATRLTFIRSLWAGNLVHDVEKIHRKYGPVVRTAPDEISFAKADAWPDIYATRPGHLPFPKNPVFWSAQPGQADSIITVKSAEEHARMRRPLSQAFTERALLEQEPFVQRYVVKLVERLKELAAKQPPADGALVDIVKWLNFTTFDIVGDLGFNEPFHCLEKSEYHPWVELIANHFKASALVAAIRFYPLVESLMMKMIPQSIMDKQRDHFQHVVDKVQRRLSLEVQRPDFMSPLIHQNQKDGMTQDELASTFNIITVAGSETTATVLSGTLNYLTRNPKKLATMVYEIRTTFTDPDVIKMKDLQSLPYLNAVIHEGMRLCPPIPAGLPRLVPEGGDTVCGVHLPNGTAVSVHAWSLSRDPESFHRPLDFEPERWLDAADSRRAPEFAADELRATQPFSVGPRHCIGKNLAWAEMRLILARLLWQFDIDSKLPGGRSNPKWELQKTWMLVEKQPLVLRIKLRGQ